MKVTIENKFYPSLIEMENCAQVLYYGLVEKNTKHILSIEEANLLKELLKIYTQTYKRHTDNEPSIGVPEGLGLIFTNKKT